MLSLMACITPQWVAGFFDGEGCVCLFKKDHGHRIELGLVVSFSQKDSVILGMIGLKYLGGLLSGHDNTKQYFKLSYCGRNAEEFLNANKDHVVVKRSQVLLALEYIETLKFTTNAHTDEVWAKRQEIYNGLKIAKGKEIQ